jgi:hypothetical protein
MLRLLDAALGAWPDQSMGESSPRRGRSSKCSTQSAGTTKLPRAQAGSSSERLRLPGLAEAAGVAEGECGADECEVAEGLGEVSELAVVVGVVFFGEQADVVTEVEQAFEQLSCFFEASLVGEHFGEPKRAGEEYPFAAR